MTNSLKYLGVVVCIMVGSSLCAEPWSTTVDANLTLTQTAYSDNWIGGEAGVLSWTSSADLLAERQLHTRVHNKNTLRLAFGQTYSQDKETKEWSDPLKSTDLIDFETVFRFTFGAFVDPFTAGRIETRFYEEGDADNPRDNGRVFNPADFKESVGVAKVLVKEEKRELIARLGAALRQHLDRNVWPDADTVSEMPIVPEPETDITTDGGVEFVTDFTTPLAQEQMVFTSRLTLYKALFFSESDELIGQPHEDYWQYPDVDWENTLTANITDYVMVNLYFQLLYDREIDPGTRFKQTLSLGLSFKIL